MKIDIAAFERARLLVAGDVMVDRYWQGDTLRISPEAPVPVVQVNAMDDRPGGAANVALNLAALGAACTVIGVVGDDEPATALEGRLRDAGITPHFHCQPDTPTITKLRVMSRHQQLLRLDFEEPLDGAAAAILAPFEASLAEADVVILSDYAKGTLSDAPALIAAARKAGKRVLVDPKGSDMRRYRDASVLTPNMAELEALVGPCPDEATLAAKGEALRAELNLEALLITRSEKGMSLLRADCAPVHQPTHAREVFDVTGAGDTVIAVLGLALASGHGYEEAMTLANLAAGIAVGKSGTTTVSVGELYAGLNRDKYTEFGVVEPPLLHQAVAAARANGERIVLTNGCFDILHAGHVAYLEEAAKLGDRLIVAVNSDASVARLKGPQRPINPLSRRMQVLAGLGAVDWVVAFDDDTPAALIGEVLPDVLVKGGDYRPDDIAGADAVRAAGGEVVVLPFVDGVSTTAMVRSILDRH